MSLGQVHRPSSWANDARQLLTATAIGAVGAILIGYGLAFASGVWGWW